MNALPGRPGTTSPTEVLLVSMPFGMLNSPSLALGILQARLRAGGIDAACRHFTIDYAARIGFETYNRIAAGFPRTTDLLGEWIFSHAVSAKSRDQQQRYVSRILGGDSDLNDVSAGRGAGWSNELRIKLLETVLSLAAGAGEFADYAAHDILGHSPKVVGFTTVFQQNMAAVAVAARIRRLDPSVKIILGGANCEGPMGQELARAYPFIDVVVSGEADLAILPLVQGLLAGTDPRENLALQPHLDGATGAGAFLQTRMTPDLESYATPSFDDYFDDLAHLGKRAGEVKVQIPVETSRGCWWGMKHHCTFCGLNGSTMAFRSKAPDAALREILETSSRYPEAKISFVDNIMDYRYFDQLLPRLAEARTGLDLFYEIKSNVTKAQVKALKAAGVAHIQPGIESLSDQVLKVMRKGVRAIQNIQLLKWCRELGVEVDWNLLWGFPGEDPAEYERMARLVPLITHLQPPARGTEIRLDRFSPNFTASEALGFSNVRPYAAYYDVYSDASREAVFNLSYFFEGDSEAGRRLKTYTRPLLAALEQWKACHPASGLSYLESGGRVVIVDSRPMSSGGGSRLLDELQSKIFLYCDTARSLAAIRRRFPDASPDDLAAILLQFREQQTMWFDGERYLSLAVSFTAFMQSRETAGVEEAIDSILSSRARPRPVVGISG